MKGRYGLKEEEEREVKWGQTARERRDEGRKMKVRRSGVGREGGRKRR